MSINTKILCGGFRLGEGLSCAGGVLSVGDLGSREIKTYATPIEFANDKSSDTIQGYNEIAFIESWGDIVDPFHIVLPLIVIGSASTKYNYREILQIICLDAYGYRVQIIVSNQSDISEVIYYAPAYYYAVSLSVRNELPGSPNIHAMKQGKFTWFPETLAGKKASYRFLQKTPNADQLCFEGYSWDKKHYFCTMSLLTQPDSSGNYFTVEETEI